MAFLEGFWRDLLYSLRGLARSPGFAWSAVAAAAIGVGSASAVFSVVDRILFRPLPHAQAERLVSVGMLAPLDSNEFMFASEYFDLRRDPGPFQAVTCFQAGTLALDVTERNPVRLEGLRVEANFLPALGVTPFLGRSFTPLEDRPNGPRVAVISHGLWRTRFHSDPQVVGRMLTLDGQSSEIVGVLPPSFETPTLTRADLLLPAALDESRERQGRAFRVFARLKDGVTVQQAHAQLGPHFARALEAAPPAFRKEVSLRVRGLRDRQAGHARQASLALLGAVFAVLLIACANVANLLLARAVGRERELAVRQALGATRTRLARLALTESLLVALGGGAAGCLLAHALLRVFVSIAPGGLPRLEEASIDPRVLAFTLGISLSCGLLFGLWPALHRPGAAALGGWRATGSSRGGLRPALVALQLGLSLAMLSSAALLLRSLWNLESIPSGLEADHVIAARFTLGRHRYQRDVDQLRFFNELEQRLGALPGVTAVALTDSLPPRGGYRGRPLNTIAVESVPRKPEGTGGMAAWRYITPGYFAALGVPIVEGRGFAPEDRAPDAYSVVLNRTMARRLFPDGKALGKRILRDPPNDWFTVVGVAADVRRGAGPAAEPEYYLLRKPAPDAVWRNQEPPTGWRQATAVLRTAIDPALAAGPLRRTLAALDDTLPVEIETMRARMESVHAAPRFNAFLLALFAAAALVLAVVGLFGVLSYLTAQRAREFGVRMALGATPRAILRESLGRALRWTAAGVVLGAAGSAVAARWLKTLLYEVAPFDPAALGAALAVLALAALAASALPARRAARLDPLVALREE